jgi:hypothetical protein
MSDCTLLSDRMPAVARGTVRWSAIDEAHLEACRDCSAEWQLVRRASVVGRSIEIRHPEAVAGGVLAALRAPAPPARTRVLRWIVPAAIAAALILVMLPRPRGEVPPDSTGPVLSLLPEAESLTEAELAAVIRMLPAADPADVSGVDSLTEEELNDILKDMDG